MRLAVLLAVVLCVGCGPSYDDLTQRLVNERALLRDAQMALMAEEVRQKAEVEAYESKQLELLEPTGKVFEKHAHYVETVGVGLKQEVVDDSLSQMGHLVDTMIEEWLELQEQQTKRLAEHNARVTNLQQRVWATEQSLSRFRR